MRRRAAEARLRDYGEEATSSGAEAGAADQVLLKEGGCHAGMALMLATQPYINP